MQNKGSKRNHPSQQGMLAQGASWTAERTSIWLRLGSLCLLLVKGKNWPLVRAISWVLQKGLRNTALAASAARMIRSRPWLGGFATICGLLVWVYVDFKPAAPHSPTPLPADAVFVFDDDSPLAEFGEDIVDVSAVGLSADRSPSNLSGSRLERRLGREGFLAKQTDENETPETPRDVPPFESVELSEKRAVWLTGTIEEISEFTPIQRTAQSDRFLPSRK